MAEKDNIKTSEVLDWKKAAENFSRQQEIEEDKKQKAENLRKLQLYKEEQLRNNINKELKVSSNFKEKEKEKEPILKDIKFKIMNLYAIKEKFLNENYKKNYLSVSLNFGRKLFSLHLPVKFSQDNNFFIIDEERLQKRKHIEFLLKKSGIENPVEFFNNNILNKPIEKIKEDIQKDKEEIKELIKSIPNKKLLISKINDRRKAIPSYNKQNKFD